MLSAAAVLPKVGPQAPGPGSLGCGGLLPATGKALDRDVCTEHCLLHPYGREQPGRREAWIAACPPPTCCDFEQIIVPPRNHSSDDVPELE